MAFLVLNQCRKQGRRARSSPAWDILLLFCFLIIFQYSVYIELLQAERYWVFTSMTSKLRSLKHKKTARLIGDNFESITWYLRKINLKFTHFRSGARACCHESLHVRAVVREDLDLKRALDKLTNSVCSIGDQYIKICLMLHHYLHWWLYKRISIVLDDGKIKTLHIPLDPSPVRAAR